MINGAELLAHRFDPADDIATLFQRRVKHAPASIRKKVYFNEYLEHQLWSFDKYAILAVDSKKGITDAKRRAQSSGDPFPHLITFSCEPSAFKFATGVRGTAFIGMTLNIGKGYAVVLAEDASITFSRVNIVGQLYTGAPLLYEICAAYIVCFGRVFSKIYYADIFDDLITKHISTVTSLDDGR
jgi:hypothetical protein